MALNQQKTVIVLGMARSGTSMTAGILHMMGVNMGSDIHCGGWNPRGDFEDLEFRNLNFRIFDSLGAHFYQNPPTITDIIQTKHLFENEVRQLVKGKSSIDRPWGWKDPLTCMTIEIILPHLTNPYFVCVSRNPEGIATSLQRHAKLDYEYAKSLANQYIHEIDSFKNRHPELPFLDIEFEKIINSPIATAAALADFLKINLADSSIAEIETFILPRDRVGTEKRKAAIMGLLFFRAPRFIKKCINTPLNLPTHIKQLFRNNFRT
ncbi:MAG: sulfotransferase [bacterium]